MFDEIKKYPIDIITLVLGLIILAYLFILSSYSVRMQRVIVVFGAVYYFVWGLLHHILRGDFSLGVIMEYLFLSLLGLGAGWFVLGWI